MKFFYGLVLGLLAVSGLQAALITIGTPGVGADELPIGTFSAAGDEYQEIYSSTLFGAGAVQINSISFSSSAFSIGAATSISGDATLILSSTSLTPGAPGSYNPANRDGDAATVFSGTFSDTLAHDGTFDVIFNFSTPYLYDPTAGNLLLDFVWNSTPTENGTLELSAVSSALVGRNSDTSEYGAFATSDFGATTQFAVAPEPASMLLLGGGLVFLGYWKRRQ